MASDFARPTRSLTSDCLKVLSLSAGADGAGVDEGVLTGAGAKLLELCTSPFTISVILIPF